MTEVYLLWGLCVYESYELLGVYETYELAQEALNAEGKLKPQSGGYGGYDSYKIEPFPFNCTIPVKFRVRYIPPFPQMPTHGHNKDVPKRKLLLSKTDIPYSLI